MNITEARSESDLCTSQDVGNTHWTDTHAYVHTSVTLHTAEGACRTPWWQGPPPGNLLRTWFSVDMVFASLWDLWQVLPSGLHSVCYVKSQPHSGNR